MSTTVSTEDLPHLWSRKFISAISDLRLADTYIEAWLSDIVSVASPVIQLSSHNTKIRLTNHHPEPQQAIQHNFFLAMIYQCYTDTLEAFPELLAITQSSQWENTFLAKVNQLGMPNVYVAALSSHIARRIGSVTRQSTTVNRFGSAPLGPPISPAVYQSNLAYFTVNIDNFWRVTLNEYPKVEAQFKRDACCDTFLNLIAQQITTRIELPSWRFYIRLKAEGLRYLLDDDITKALDGWAHQQGHQSHEQLVICQYYAGQGVPQPNQLDTVFVQPLFLQSQSTVVTEDSFRQRVDWCFREARRSQQDATLMTQNAARVLLTVPP